MKETLLNSPEDMDWLFETHLKHRNDRRKWKSALVSGNEDCPKEVRLYAAKNPLISDGYLTAILDYKAV